ncbi:MAG: hypothetical protein R3C26_02525 [Calditrichia bacterium]
MGIYVFDGGIFALWTSVTAYVCSLCFAFLWRFKQGKWRDMRVIEQN